MRVLLIKSEGADVEKWQSFLFGIGYEYVETDGVFDSNTEKATKGFQSRSGLTADGKVGNATYAAAVLQGFPIISTNDAYPPKPDFPYPSNEERERMLGKFDYARLGDGSIKIKGDWTKKNLVTVHIPQLIGIKNAPQSGNVTFHKNGASQLKALFAAWEKAGLLKYIRTWAGTYNPRMIRGSRTAVSNHAYGSAFDINAAWNGLGIAPPLAGEVGSVVPLVALANAHGFYWGGHYTNRKDGMHFELAVLDRYPKPIKFVSSQTSSAADAPAVISPQLNAPESSDAHNSDAPAAENLPVPNPAENSADPAPPPIQSAENNQAVEVPQVKPETEPPKEVGGIQASFAAAVTFITTTGAGILTWAADAKWEIVACLAGVGAIFFIARFVYVNQEKKREHNARMEREKQAHELQILTLKSAMDKDLNTVKITPQPIQNSERETIKGFASLPQKLTWAQRLKALRTGKI